MRASEFIIEAFDQPYPVEWERGDYGTDALAQLPDGTYLSIMFNDEYDHEGEEVIQVEFERNNSQSVTGEGDAQRIFATVLESIKQFIKDRHPKQITFAADKEPGPSRASLYTKLVNRFAKPMGYQVDSYEAGTSLHFDLTRKFGLREFAPDDSSDEENTLHKYARMWYNGDLGTQQKVEKVLDRMGWEIGEIESEEGGVFVVKAGDENGNSYIGFAPEDLSEGAVNEKWSQKYKSSINCSNPKGFSQKAHCAGKAKNENFADGRNPQDKGDSKRHGINTKASVSSLRKTAKQGGRKGQLAHWLANMKAGRAKKK